MPRSRGKRRRRSSGRLRRLSALIAALLLLLLTLLISWIFGRRATDDGAGREPERPRNTSVGPEGPAPRRLPLRPTRPPGAAGATDDRPAGAAERTITADTAAGVALIGGSIVASDGRPILGARVELRRALDRSIGPGLPAAFVARATTRAPTGRFEIAAPVDLGQGGLLVEILGRLHFLGWFGVEPWSGTDLGSLTVRADPPRPRLAVKTPGGPAAGAVCRLRPQPPETPLGPAPWDLDDRSGPFLVAGADGFVDLGSIGGGDWEILILADGFRPYLLRLGAETARPIELEAEPESTPPLPNPPRDRWILAETGGASLIARADSPFAGRLLSAERPAARLVPGAGRITDQTEPSRGLLEVPPPAAAGPAMPRLRRRPVDGEDAEIVSFVDEMLGNCGFGPRPARAGDWELTLEDADTGEVLFHHAAVAVAAGGRQLVTWPATPPLRRRLEGRVTEADGRPAAGAAIRIMRSFAGLDPFLAPILGRAGDDGGFVIDGLPAGRLQAHVSRAESPALVCDLRLEEAQGSRTTVDWKLRSGAALEVFALGPDGRPAGPIDILVIDRQGQVLRKSCDESGRALFPSVAPGEHVVAAAVGEPALPLDAWEWLERGAGGRLPVVPETGRLEHRLELPPSRPWTLRLDVSDAPSGELTGEISSDRAADPKGGLLRLKIPFRFRNGERVLIDPIFPGRYVAVAWSGLESSIVEFEIPAQGDLPDSLSFRFRKE